MNYLHFGAILELLPEIPSDSIVSRTLYNGDDLKVILFGFAAGQALSEHTAAKPAVLHFLSGEADVVVGEDAILAGPGTWVYMEPNLPHSVTARTEVAMLLELLQAG